MQNHSLKRNQEVRGIKSVTLDETQEYLTLSLGELKALAESDNAFDREFVADYLFSPPELLREIADKEKPLRSHIWCKVLRNPNAPEDILRNAVEIDERKFVRMSVAENPNCPIDLLEKFQRDSTFCNINVSLAKNQNTPTYLLARLVSDKNPWVAYHLFRNPNSDEDILLKIKSLITSHF